MIRRVAKPVPERLCGHRGVGRPLGGGRGVAYLDFSGFVVALTAEGLPAMPNGVTIRGPLPDPRRSRAYCLDGVIELGGEVVDLTTAPVWNPRVASGAGDLEARGEELLLACGIAPAHAPDALAHGFARAGLEAARDPEGRAGIELLLASIPGRTPGGARGAARRLIGRGPGLTPEGDDIVGGVAATVAAHADPAEEWRAAVCPPDAPARTGALSATLLELGARALVFEPVGVVLDLGAPEKARRAALDRLLGIGHGTGRAWAAGCGAAAMMLAVA